MASRDSQTEDERKNQVRSKIFGLAIPNFLTTLSIPLLSMADTALTGRMEGLTHLGAVAIGGTIFNLLFWAFGFLRMGTTGICAQAYGASRFDRLSACLYRSFLLAIVIGVFLLLSSSILEEISFYFLKTDPQMEATSREYFKIRLYSAPAVLILYVLNGYFLGIHKAMIPLYLGILSNLGNIFLNLVFVLGFGFHSDGIAYATVISQYLGVILGMYYLFLHKDFLCTVSLSDLFDPKDISDFLKSNTNLFIRTVVLLLCLNFFNFQSASMGEQMLAVNALIMQLWSLMAYGVDGFAVAAESLVGEAYGKRCLRSFRDLIQGTFHYSGWIALSFFVIYFLFGVDILRLFTDKKDVLELCVSYLPWAYLAPFVNFICFCYDGIYLGCSASKELRDAMIFSGLFVFLPAWYLFEPLYGNHGLWLSMSLFMFARGFSLWYLFEKRVVDGLRGKIRFRHRLKFAGL